MINILCYLQPVEMNPNIPKLYHFSGLLCLYAAIDKPAVSFSTKPLHALTKACNVTFTLEGSCMEVFGFV